SCGHGHPRGRELPPLRWPRATRFKASSGTLHGQSGGSTAPRPRLVLAAWPFPASPMPVVWRIPDQNPSALERLSGDMGRLDVRNLRLRCRCLWARGDGPATRLVVWDRMRGAVLELVAHRECAAKLSTPRNGGPSN